jgi:DNA polymerase sigma
MKMMDRYETYEYQHQDTKDLHNRLHEEIIIFRDSVQEILQEMQPLKEALIKNIASIIKKALANSEVQVYGSHATKLCLPWSDIDLVVKTNVPDHFQSSPKHCLSIISRELMNEQTK